MKLTLKFGSQRGLTLVELIVASTIFTVIALSSAVLFASVLKLGAKSKLVEEVQREGDAAVAGMSRNLRDGVSVDTTNTVLTGNPQSLQVKLTNNQTRRYYVTGGQLHYVNESGVDQNLLLPGTTVTSLTFTPASDTIGLQVITAQLTLSRTKAGQTQALSFGSTINTRPQ